MEREVQPIRLNLQYNPFILKLIHIKALYLDRLLVAYLPTLARDKHDLMRRFITDAYHIDMLLSLIHI